MRRRLALLALAAAAGCTADFTPRSVVDDLRVLALLATPLELGPGERVALRAVTVTPPGGAVASERWTFCPFSVGAQAGYACAVPSCETELAPAADGSVSADPTALAQACLAGLAAGGGLPATLPSALPATVEVVFRYVATAATGQVREAVQLVPLHTAGPPASPNHPPVLLGVEIGGQAVAAGDTGPPLASGAELEVRAIVDPASAETYQDSAGQSLRESLVTSFYTSAGRFDFDRANGPDARVKLKREQVAAGTTEAELWVVARDLRGGQAVAGPFHVPIP
jgi:hypothetical protein